MNIYKVLNEITQYIEENLENEIDYNVLAKKMGVNVYSLQRLFSLLAGLSLSEYIRKRRLTCAGQDLCLNKEKIIDVAVKYQYDNATSFSRAFEKFHGIKPSKVNNSIGDLKNYPRIVFEERINIREEMSYRIVELPEKRLYGMGIKTSNKTISKDAPELFEKMKELYKEKYGDIDYGLVNYEDRFESDNYEYWVLWDKEINEDGFKCLVIPESKWLVFTINSTEAEEIQRVSYQFYYEFLTSCKFNLRDIPELEYYHDGITEFLVPIE